MNIRRLALCAAAALLACSHPHAETAEIVDRSRPAKGVYEVPPVQMASVIEAQLRVAPDRRFLLAARDIDEVLTGRRETIFLDFANGRWNVRAGEAEAFSLPDLPTFANGLDALTAFATKLRGNSKRADFTALADQATRLNTKQPDGFGVADQERARALALIALARSVDARAAAVDATVMADVCGYTTERAELEKAAQQTVDDRGARTLPAAIYELHHRATVFSKAYDSYFDAVEQLGSEPDAERLAESLSGAREGVASEVARWVRDAVALRVRGGEGVAIDKSIAAMPDLGGERRAELLLMASRTFGTTTPPIRRAAFAMFAQCDSRPSNLYWLGRVANDILRDPSRRDRYLAAARDRAKSTLDRAVGGWIPAAIGDQAGLRAIVSSPTESAADRAAALAELAKLDGVDQKEVAALFETLVNRNSKAYSLFVTWANEHHEWVLKEKLARRALATESNTIAQAYIATSLADALMHQGRNADALHTVEPFVDVGSFSILSGMMEALAANGDAAGADAIGQQLMGRYPGADANVACARVLWKQKRYADAAALVDPKTNSLVPLQLAHELAYAFHSTFDDARADAAAAAFTPIVPLISSDTARTVLGDLLYYRRDALVFALAKPLLEHPAHRTMPERVLAWRAARAVQGPAAASAWLRAHVPDDDRVALVLEAHQSADELVADYALPAALPRKTHEMELLIAASLVRLHVPANDARMAGFTDSIRAQPPANDYFLAATRYLLGIDNERAMFAGIDNVHGRASAAYFRGLRAAYEGRYDDAMPWLLVAEATPEEIEWPLTWSLGQLNRWSDTHLSWSEIKRRRVP